jgi:hypothetical protein
MDDVCREGYEPCDLCNYDDECDCDHGFGD